MTIIEENFQLQGYNSFGIEAKAKYFAEFNSVEDLREIFSKFHPDSINWYLLSGGNNILFTKDFDGLIIHPTACKAEVVASDAHKVMVRAEAGMDWNLFIDWCLEQGFAGIENLSGIPGFVGSSPIQNIGAYGAEAGDRIVSVEVFDPWSGHIAVMSKQECRFGYRESVFKNELKGKRIITSVTFELLREPQFCLGYGDVARKVESLGGPTLESVRKAVMEIRDGKLPDPKKLGNAGSFFKNPIVEGCVADELLARWPDIPIYTVGCGGQSRKLAAGWLLDQSGWKGRRVGNVGVHQNQALVLVNYGGATGQQILELSDMVRQSVKDKFGVEIEPEVNVL